MTPGKPGLEIATAIPTSADHYYDVQVSCQVCWRRKRWHHGRTVTRENLLSVKVF